MRSEYNNSKSNIRIMFDLFDDRFPARGLFMQDDSLEADFLQDPCNFQFCFIVATMNNKNGSLIALSGDFGSKRLFFRPQRSAFDYADRLVDYVGDHWHEGLKIRTVKNHIEWINTSHDHPTNSGRWTNSHRLGAPSIRDDLLHFP